MLKLLPRKNLICTANWFKEKAKIQFIFTKNTYLIKQKTFRISESFHFVINADYQYFCVDLIVLLCNN